MNPVDLGAAVSAAGAARTVEILLGADEVDSVLTVFTELLVGDAGQIQSTISAIAHSTVKPIVCVQVGDESRVVERDGRHLPIFDFPEPAAAAMGHAYRYARLRARGDERAQRPANLDRSAARRIVEAAGSAGLGWLGPAEVADLLAAYGIEVCAQRVVTGTEAAVSAARELGYPVVVKTAGGTVHKSDVGGVRLNLQDDDAVAEAVAALDVLVSGAPVLLQPMLGAGLELIAGIVQDAQFGPVVMLGAGGVTADVLADRSFALAPTSTAAAHRMMDALRCAPLLKGYRGRPGVSHDGLAKVVVALSWLAEDLPEVAELDLNPLVCDGDRISVVDARIRVSVAAARSDPLARGLRDATGWISTTTKEESDE